MPKPRNLFPFIALRARPDGTIRPRFVPSARERALGFAGVDLKHPNGDWFTLDEVRDYARARHGEIVAARRGEERQAGRAPASVGDLLEAWINSPDVRALAAHTQRSYRDSVQAIRFAPRSKEDRAALRPRRVETFAGAPARAVGKPEVKAFFEYLVRVRGHHAASAAIAALRAAYSWGALDASWRLAANPAAALRLRKPAPRIMVYTIDEIRHLIATADVMGLASVGDSIMLGVFTGQRQGDRLALVDEGLVAGRRHFRQAKTGAVVAIPETPMLAERMREASARVAAIKLAMPEAARPKTAIVCEATRAPWNGSSYKHAFARVRAQAAIAMPSLGAKRDQDLRDTAVTWLARAGATLPEIAAITGHSLASIHGVLRHYLAITPELADTAIAKMVGWLDREGTAS